MRVRIGDVSLFVDFDGAGLVTNGPEMRQKPTLLLLHGGPGFDHSNFKPAFSCLSDVAQIVYFDHRGQGRSDLGRPGEWNLDNWADDVVALCTALGIEQPIVLGLSFGGMVAQAYATKYPEHPSKLILMSTAARIRLDRVFAAFERLGGSQVREVAEAFWADPNSDSVQTYLETCLPFYTQSPADPDMLARSVMNTDVLFHFSGKGGEFTSFDFLPKLNRVACPTLVMGGTEDPVTPFADAEDIAAALPVNLVRLEKFDGCGHGVYRDDPDHAFQLLREFICA